MHGVVSLVMAKIYNLAFPFKYLASRGVARDAIRQVYRICSESPTVAVRCKCSCITHQAILCDSMHVTLRHVGLDKA